MRRGVQAATSDAKSGVTERGALDRAVLELQHRSMFGRVGNYGGGLIKATTFAPAEVWCQGLSFVDGRGTVHGRIPQRCLRLGHKTDMPTRSPHIRYQGVNGIRADAAGGPSVTPCRHWAVAARAVSASSRSYDQMRRDWGGGMLLRAKLAPIEI